MTDYAPTATELGSMRSTVASTLVGAVTAKRATDVRDDRGGHTQTLAPLNDPSGSVLHRARWHAEHWADDKQRAGDQNRGRRHWRVVLPWDTTIRIGDRVTIPGVVSDALVESCSIGSDSSFGAGSYVIITEAD